MYLKKYLVQVQKNQTTFQDDLLIKPDPNKTSNMKNSNVDKLNEKGYAPEETRLEFGDVIFGKVTQVTDPNAKKPYRDSSEIYKMHTPGVVDRMYIDVPNADGYLTREALIRCEKYPRIGDKYCFPESANVEVLTTDGWINIQNITKQHKVASLIDNSYISYENPTELYEFDHDGDIYKLRSEYVDIDCTMNHKLYAKCIDNQEYELIEARNIIGKTFNLKKNCKNVNRDIQTFLIREKEYDMNTIINCYANLISQKLNFNEMIRMLDDEIVEYFKLILNFSKFPDWVWSLSENQSRILLENLIEETHQTFKYYASSEQFANDVMKLAIHCGWSGTLNYENNSVEIHKHNNEPQINTQNIQNESIYKYTGKIYCLEIPSHIMMIRQNGKNVWISNSSRHGNFLPKSLQIKKSTTISNFSFLI